MTDFLMEEAKKESQQKNDKCNKTKTKLCCHKHILGARCKQYCCKLLVVKDEPLQLVEMTEQ
jgi:hypothetical protein